MPQLVVNNRPVLDIYDYTLSPGHITYPSIIEAGSSTPTYTPTAITSGRLRASGRPLETDFFKLEGASRHSRDIYLQDEAYTYLLEDAFLVKVEHTYRNSTYYNVTCEIICNSVMLCPLGYEKKAPPPEKNKDIPLKKPKAKINRGLVIFKGRG